MKVISSVLESCTIIPPFSLCNTGLILRSNYYNSFSLFSISVSYSYKCLFWIFCALIEFNGFLSSWETQAFIMDWTYILFFCCRFIIFYEISMICIIVFFFLFISKVVIFICTYCLLLPCYCRLHMTSNILSLISSLYIFKMSTMLFLFSGKLFDLGLFMSWIDRILFFKKLLFNSLES